MNIGFTGTRRGLTIKQIEAVMSILEANYIAGAKEFHHGNCIGADEQAAQMAKEIGYATIAHPSNLSAKYQSAFRSSVILRPEPPLVRNQIILSISQYIICCPKNFIMPESLRGQGTWWTIQESDRLMHPMVTIYPDGTASQKWHSFSS